MALTATQITDLRILVGDNRVGDQILSDAEIQTLSTLASENTTLTIIFYLKRILGETRTKIDSSTNAAGSNRSFSQLFDQTLRLLNFYIEQWKSDGGTILAETTVAIDPPIEGVGSISTYIDYTEEDLESGLY